ncbi:alpha/beta fold hydrolase [Streptomyces sp. NPDC054835]|uniref:alpha/beta fold hydrolase n=1 Tax=Streptomyces sp. NBC_01268 TaxID=2903806 RepID=UPI003FCE2341
MRHRRGHPRPRGQRRGGHHPRHAGPGRVGGDDGLIRQRPGRRGGDASPRIDPARVWPFERRTAGEQGIPQTCLHWPPSRADRPAPGRTLTMPVLLLAGDRDPSTPPAWARDRAARTPKAELVLIEGAGHSTQSRSTGGARAAERFLLRQADRGRAGARCGRTGFRPRGWPGPERRVRMPP